ncbi:putative MFS-type transporter PB1E7,08c [Schizosaccharomyces pombe 972h-] [Rhizoctonia solani]|uniref:Putative MFS-type transporter PB1E7,08c [Schizosaccharomyces pombe 972h-] n=1 Tax=Rhizoctonia solani TaxID=456999 RepID=A0A0K6GBU0_9AGAM|nr:putative MFS-type transporter PB1E7,08c [Schizosaccharomyces pombe 972h-] [Rhizoctonia solani]
MSTSDHSRPSTLAGVPTDIKITEQVLPDGSVDPVYQARAELLNDTIQRIGMGKYQKWHLFIVAGFGWLADILWIVVAGIILAPVVQEFKVQGPFLSLSTNIGLLVGALGWSAGSDVWGRKVSFNITLAIVGVFAMVAAASPNFTALAIFAALWSVGVGGNFPVDSAIFLEFLPATHQWLLTVLAIWSAFGALIASLVAWAILPNFSCEATATECRRSDNMGWRYYLILMGGLMIVLWIFRFFVFKLHESPKYLMGRGKLQEAVTVVHAVAKYNGRDTDLTVEQLEEAGAPREISERKKEEEDGQAPLRPPVMDTSALGAFRRSLREYDSSLIKMLFATPKLAVSTSLIICVWAIIGLAVPLYNAFIPYYLSSRGAAYGDGSVYITYRNNVIIGLVALPAAPFGGWAVEIPHVGRKGTLSLFTILTGVFLFLSTTARTSNALLGWNCGYSFANNVMWAALYTVTPELFPTKVRGTGNGLASSANRIFGVMSPIIALYADLTTEVPIFVSGALFLFAGIVALLLPFEPRGKASL